jgi:GTP-binding protein
MPTNYSAIPLIAVVGRPNVGKSTLVNRFIGKRRSITDPTPGVTRDVVQSLWRLGDRQVRVADTGGYTEGHAEYDRLVSERSLGAVREADVVLFVMDVTDVTPEDQAFMEAIRPYRDKVILVVNKVDNEKREAAAWAYYEYGFDALVSVSAEHGRNIDALVSEIRRLLDAAAAAGAGVEHTTGARPIRIAVLGKPNAGKSTLTNALLGEELSLVSETPGTTRDVVEGRFTWKDSDFEILDTAGIRRKKKVTEDVEYYSVNRAISTIEESDIVLLLIDAKAGLTDQDKKIASLVVERGRGLILVLNKWDLFGSIQNAFQAVRDRINFVFPVLSFAPIIPVSSTEGTGFDKLLNMTQTVYRELTRRMETGPLNQRLKRWVEETPPPMVGGRRLKLRYMTQVGVEPVVFVVFANRTRHVPDSYLGYIRNRIRQELGFGHIPFRLELRASGQ